MNRIVNTANSNQPIHPSVCVSWVCPLPDANTFGFALANGLPTLFFLLFLGSQLRRSVRKLRRTHSQIMLTYYATLWAVSALNLLRCGVMMVEARYTGQAHWNALWLLTSSVGVLLEVSVVVFLLQGYLTSGSEALLRTLALSGPIALADCAIKAALLHAGVPLFLYGGDAASGALADMQFSKWGFWMAHAACYLALYAALLALPYTKWRDRLPAKPSFYRYVMIMCGYNAVRLLATMLIAAHATVGYCVYGLVGMAYTACYPPLLYITFLHDFFRDSELDSELLYYEEMHDAGYLFDGRDGM